MLFHTHQTMWDYSQQPRRVGARLRFQVWRRTGWSSTLTRQCGTIPNSLIGLGLGFGFRCGVARAGAQALDAVGRAGWRPWRGLAGSRPGAGKGGSATCAGRPRLVCTLGAEAAGQRLLCGTRLGGQGRSGSLLATTWCV
jgi:hypothetical protein